MKYITLSFITIFAGLLAMMVYLNIKYPPDSAINNNSIVPQNTSSPLQEPLTTTNISKHSASKDCYLIVKGNVYDVSTYITMHPGGRRAITSRCGQEVTSIFASIHSNFAWNLLGKYKIGVVESASNSNADNTTQNFAPIEKALKAAYPSAEIVNIKPSGSNYIAKIINDQKLYEIHTDDKGKVTSIEVENAEFDWTNWSNYSDDQ